MARKSRKQIAGIMQDNNHIIKETNITVYSAALYARKSVDDISHGRSGESIYTQISLLKDYIKDKPEFNLYDCYMDNGETGTNFDRPQFNRLMEDIKDGRVNCVIDSNDKADSNDMMAYSIETLMDDMYSKDISQKVKSAYMARFKAGQFAGSCLPYGYLRSPEDIHKLVIDTKTAPYVKLIYEMAADGNTYAKIAEHLNNMGAETPGQFSYRANNGTKKFTLSPWKEYNIRSILRNPVYLGHMVQGKTARSVANGIKRVHLPENEWHVVYNTHEAIIDEELYARVKPVLDKNAANYAGKKNIESREPNILHKKLICAKCGKNISRSCYYTKHKRVYFYWCLTGEACGFLRMKADKLFDVILKAIQFQIKLMADAEQILSEVEKTVDFHKKESELKKQLKQLSAEKKKIEYSRVRLYEDYREGILSMQDYTNLAAGYDEDERKLDTKLEKLSNAYEKEKLLKSKNNPCIKEFTKLKKSKKLTKEMVDTLIDKIYVHGQYEIEIVFNFRDEYESLMRELEEVK